MVVVMDTDSVRSNAIAALGLDPAATDLLSPEVLSGLIRRASTFQSPSTKRVLRETVVASLHGIAEHAELGDLVDDTIETLTGCGDLLELPSADPDVHSSMLYIAPPSFVVRTSGTILLVGGTPEGASPFSRKISQRIEYRAHTRRLVALPGEHLSEDLMELGFIQLPEKLWLRQPRIVSADEMVQGANKALSMRPESVVDPALQGLRVLDASRSNRFYPDRWRSLSIPGRFIARREQVFGAPLWSYVEFTSSRTIRLIDFPQSEWRGCDDAWHLQLALDATLGHPQPYRLRRSPPSGSVILDLLAPVPSWAQKRWDLLGEKVAPNHSLLAYRLSTQDYADERSFIRSSLWMVELSE